MAKTSGEYIERVKFIAGIYDLTDDEMAKLKTLHLLNTDAHSSALALLGERGTAWAAIVAREVRQ